HGSLMWRYGSAGNANTPTGTLATRVGRFGIRVNGAYREAQQYRAPNGSFGNITLNNNVPIFDSGIHDGSYSASVAYDLTPTTALYTRAERYQAGRAGFGYIDPANYSTYAPPSSADSS